MDERIERSLRAVRSLDDLTRLEENVARLGASTDEVRSAIRAKTAELGRALVAEKTGLDLTDLSPAEEKIIRAVSEYAGIQKRRGLPTTRTFLQLKNRGLLASAEVSVTKPTKGFETLSEEDRADLSYEQIIVDHPEEFSARAQWFARRTLGIPNDSATPPAPGASRTQEGTEQLLAWLRDRSASNDGYLRDFTNAQAAAAIGITDMHRSGRVFGNIQLRIDYACYELGLPPLCLTANEPFDMAWSQGDRDWTFPIETMQTAARQRRWTRRDFDRIFAETRDLPGQAHVSWKRELTGTAARVRAWASGLAGRENEQGIPAPEEPESEQTGRNPPWVRDELILALDLYLRHRASPPSKNSEEVAALSKLLSRLASVRGASEAETFRNANGVYMKMMNFRRFDPEYTADGKVGLSRGNKLEEVVWNEFADDPTALAVTVADIRGRISGAPIAAAPYWVFVCNPKKWAIDRFLDKNIERDTWGVRPSDRERFAPGQLGIIRVGVDRRSAAERDGKPPLDPGIYALCEVESEAFDGTGANDEFWTEGEEREPGWPTVRVRYLRNFLHRPLTIERLRAEAPGISSLLLDGFQASSFPISADDFHTVVGMLGVDVDEAVANADDAVEAKDAPTALQDKYLHAAPEVKERVSKYIERGSTGNRVKKERGFKCQVCEAIGRDPIAFRKNNGEPYAEAHHVMPVSELQAGSLAASNIMVLCATHHRQMHYGGVPVRIEESTFDLTIDGSEISVARLLT